MEVLVDRYVRVTDELEEMIQEMGAEPLDLRVASVLKALPPCSSTMQRHAQEQRALDAEIRRYRAEVEEPAFAILRERKASGGGGGGRMHKEPVTFSPSAYYPEVLDGIDLRLPAELPATPGVTPLTLAISWPPGHHLRNYPISGFISSCHGGYLALHFGNYLSGSSSTRCYLVIDTCANSIAIVPPLPPECFTTKSLGSIGFGSSGVGILHQSRHGFYVLVELYLRRRKDDDLGFSNKATMFVWWSTGSGPLADQWIQKEVVLPLPLPAHQDRPAAAFASSFRANMVLAVGTTALCWVDLWTGILVCNGIHRLADGGADDDDDLVFHFIALPEECTIISEPLFRRSEAEHSRSMSIVDPRHMVFVCMDGKAMLTTWRLRFPLTQDWFWEKGPSLCIPDLLDRLSIAKGDPKLQRLTPSCPVISGKQPDVVHIFVTEFEKKDERDKWKIQGYYEFSANIQNGLLLSVFEFPPGSQPFPHARICATEMRCILPREEEDGMTSICCCK